MAKKKILIPQPLHADGMALLTARKDVDLVVLDSSTEAALVPAARDVHAIVVRTARIDRAVIGAAPLLEIVSRHGVGYDAIDVEALNARRIPLALAIHSNMVSVAEHVMFMLLTLVKEGAAYDAMTRSGDWRGRVAPMATDLTGKNLLVVGFGRTGSRVAQRALAFDMKVHVSDPFIDQALISKAGCVPVPDLRKALPQMDAVSTNCPLSEATRHLFSSAEFDLMKPTAVIVNCARGGILDEAALHAALSSRRIRAAGLDVFDTEPTPTDNPLLSLPNLIVSPHIAGVTQEAMVRMSTQSAQNVLDHFDGKLDPDTVVNRAEIAA